ncbi:MAG: hypothetical protein OSJ68_11240, partial [Clostridia bacterium]|nr:hypothetical protein [Clostridia bacterium]
AAGFKATLFGGKHSFKNAKFAGANDPFNSGGYIMGLFGVLNNAKIYDINIDNSCKYSFSPSATVRIGGIAAHSINTYLVNCSSYANITMNNSALNTNAQNNVRYNIGGLIGEERGSSTRFYLCSYKGTIEATAFGANVTDSGNDCHAAGGFIGLPIANVTADGCFVDVKLLLHRGGINACGIGGGWYASDAKDVITNTIVIMEIKEDGVIASHDTSMLINRPSTTAQPVATNVYCTLKSGSTQLKYGNFFCNTPTTTYTNAVCNYSTSDGGAPSSSITVNANPNELAKNNSNIIAKFDFLPNGVPVPKFAPFFSLFSLAAIYLAGL